MTAAGSSGQSRIHQRLSSTGIASISRSNWCIVFLESKCKKIDKSFCWQSYPIAIRGEMKREYLLHAPLAVPRCRYQGPRACWAEIRSAPRGEALNHRKSVVYWWT